MGSRAAGARLARRDYSGAAIGFLGVLVVGIVVVSSSFISRTAIRDNAMERTAGDLRVRVALAHLGLESALAGRQREGLPAGEVYANLSAARASCETMLAESRTRWSAQDRGRVRTLCRELEEFRALTTTRLNNETTARLENQVLGAGTDVYKRNEQRYDILFRQIMTRAEQASDAIGDIARSHERGRDRVQTVVVAVLAVVFTAMAALTRRNRLTREAKSRESARLAAIVESSSDAIIGADLDGTIVSWNAAAERLHGYREEEIVGRAVTTLFPADNRQEILGLVQGLERGEVTSQHETAGVTSAGRVIELWLTVSPVREAGRIMGASIIARDITDRRQAEEELRGSKEALALQAAGMQHRAFHDPLTNLANRALFTDRVDHSLARAPRSQASVAVLFLDLDGFKAINDSLGHAMGDRLLIDVAARLVDCVRPSDTVARLGGDEFAVLVDPLGEPAEASLVADRILEGLRPPFVLAGKQHFIQASIGVTVTSGAGEDAGDLLRNADLAMYVAKAHGKGRHETFEPAMHSAVLQRMELEAELRRALEHDELEVHYQPIVDIERGKLSGVEALVRWNHPRRELVQPSDFISLAEDTGLIVVLGYWVLQQACSQVRQWQTDYPSAPPIRVSVNMSARQLQPALIEQVSRAVGECQLDPADLTLEITESLLTDESEETIAYLRALHGLGVKLAIDDFGTGYSSLSRLRRFPVDSVKIDKSFVGQIPHSKEGGAIVAAMIAMAQGLNLDVVAEGVETQAQLRFLLAHGCPRVQGYLLGRPVGAAGIEELLASPLDDLQMESTAEDKLDSADDGEADYLALFADRTGDAGHLEEVTRLVLAKLQQVTGLDSTFLSRPCGTEGKSEIIYAYDGGKAVMPEGSQGPWFPNIGNGPTNEGGSTGRDGPVSEAPAGVLASLGLATYFGVPVVNAEGALFGTLCGVSAQHSLSAERVIPLMQLFARLVADCLEGSVSPGLAPLGTSGSFAP